MANFIDNQLIYVPMPNGRFAVGVKSFQASLGWTFNFLDGSFKKGFKPCGDILEFMITDCMIYGHQVDWHIREHDFGKTKLAKSKNELFISPPKAYFFKYNDRKFLNGLDQTIHSSVPSEYSGPVRKLHINMPPFPNFYLQAVLEGRDLLFSPKPSRNAPYGYYFGKRRERKDIFIEMGDLGLIEGRDETHPFVGDPETFQPHATNRMPEDIVGTEHDWRTWKAEPGARKTF